MPGSTLKPVATPGTHEYGGTADLCGCGHAPPERTTQEADMWTHTVDKDCLIGHTGFVGGCLKRQHGFDGLYNSTNIDNIGVARYGTAVCAAAPGSMFEANKFPERDEAKIKALMDQLSRVQSERFVLISSIAVLADFAGKDNEDSTAFQETLAYGRHRRMLEAFCETHFDNCLVVRLPALFGKGLRKNFIFDLLNPVPTMLPEARLEALCAELDPALAELVNTLYSRDPAIGMLKLDRAKLDADPQRAALDEAFNRLGFSAMQFHNPATTYQYYDMSRLWADIGIATEAGLSHVHLATEPLEARRIHLRLKGSEMPETGAQLHHEDMRTRRASLWGRDGSSYLADAESVLDRLSAFYAVEQRMPA